MIGKGPHRRDRDGLFGRQRAHPRHAHERRATVHLGATRAAFARFAVPPYGEVGRLGRLYPVDDVEDDLTFLRREAVLHEAAAARVPAPQAHDEVLLGWDGRLRRRSRSGRLGVDCHQCASSANSFAKSSGICGLGSWVKMYLPSTKRVTILTFSNSGLKPG